MTGTPAIRLRSTVLNSPDPEALAGFYSRLLGWPVVDSDPTWARLERPGGDPGIAVQIEDIYERPVWPAAPGTQQMMLHLDFQVDDLAAAGAHAEACGATLATFQSDTDHLRVYLDPDGHPFCLFTE